MNKLLQPTSEVGVGAYKPTINKRLADEKQHLEKRLTEVNNALDALNAQPEVAELLESIFKVL